MWNRHSEKDWPGDCLLVVGELLAQSCNNCWTCLVRRIRRIRRTSMYTNYVCRWIAILWRKFWSTQCFLLDSSKSLFKHQTESLQGCIYSVHRDMLGSMESLSCSCWASGSHWVLLRSAPANQCWPTLSGFNSFCILHFTVCKTLDELTADDLHTSCCDTWAKYRLVVS